MALDAATQQTLILVETGTQDDSEVADNIANWWARFEGKDSQYELTQLSVLRYKLARARKKIDITTGPDRIYWSQEAKNIQAEITALQAEIKRNDSIYDSSSGFGTLTPDNFSNEVEDTTEVI